MELLKLFKLEKLTIEMYGNKRRIGVPISTLKVMFNPASYTMEYVNEYSSIQGINSNVKASRYILSKPAKLSLTLIIDGTGVAEFGLQTLISRKDVYATVQEFLKNTADLDGNIHEPRYLKIIWGKLNFACRLDSVTVNYTLFDQSGNPLRAELQTEFTTDTDTEKGLKKSNLTSPDLTHSITVKTHDTLPMLCEAVYGTPDCYLEVAKANKLLNFRVLTPGQELYFPPVNK